MSKNVFVKYMYGYFLLVGMKDNTRRLPEIPEEKVEDYSNNGLKIIKTYDQVTKKITFRALDPNNISYQEKEIPVKLDESDKKDIGNIKTYKWKFYSAETINAAHIKFHAVRKLLKKKALIPKNDHEMIKMYREKNTLIDRFEKNRLGKNPIAYMQLNNYQLQCIKAQQTYVAEFIKRDDYKKFYLVIKTDEIYPDSVLEVNVPSSDVKLLYVKAKNLCKRHGIKYIQFKTNVLV